MKYPPLIQKLIEQFSKLPTVGPKTAERYVFYLIKQGSEVIDELIESLKELKKSIVTCRTCQAISTSSPCPICDNNRRDRSLLCIIADTRDMYAIEETGQYQGYYHVLNSNLNAIENTGLSKSNLESLLAKLRTDEIKEILLALNPDISGNTTSLYLTKLLKPFNLKITRLAQGLPTGANIEYADEATIVNALKFRNEIK
ncbi:MAG: recombination mediator RecR [bacterium]